MFYVTGMPFTLLKCCQQLYAYKESFKWWNVQTYVIATFITYKKYVNKKRRNIFLIIFQFFISNKYIFSGLITNMSENNMKKERKKFVTTKTWSKEVTTIISRQQYRSWSC